MSRSYQVGYGKPPLETRFRKGQSGNPKGRAKGVKNVSTVIVEAMTQTVTVTIDGRRVQMSKLQAAATQQANKAAAGDPKATGLMFQMLTAFEAREMGVAEPPPDAETRRKRDEVLVAALLARAKPDGDCND